MTDANAILVCSGKGGTGKTLISLNIARKLLEKDRRVGLLDSDFSSTSIKDFINLPEKMDLSGEKFHPMTCEGMKVFSVSMLFGDEALSMDGGQYSELMRDAVKSSEWGELDYIVVDAPPGFGEIWRRTIEVFENFLGCVIVGQPAHKLDLRRAIALCKDLDIEIIGLIENMSYLQVGEDKWNIFGDSGVAEIGKEFGVDVFGQIPLSMDIRHLVEARKPFLTGELGAPIDRAVEKIISVKAKKPGYLERMRALIGSAVDKALIEIVKAANKEIDIGAIQKRFSYPGGSIIQINFMKEDMEHIISQWTLMVHEGKLVAVEGDPAPDYRVDIKPEAIKWAMLGNRTMTDGSKYDLKRALTLGDMRVWGEASMARGAYFMRDVFEELSKNESAMTKIRPILEVL